VQVDEADLVAMVPAPRGELGEGERREDPQLLRCLFAQRLLVGSFVVLDEEDLGLLLGHGHLGRENGNPTTFRLRSERGPVNEP